MLKQAEPKSADFLLQKSIPIHKPENTTVRSGEARQSSQVGGDFYFSKPWAADMARKIAAQLYCNAQYCKRCIYLNHCMNSNAKTGDKK